MASWGDNGMAAFFDANKYPSNHPKHKSLNNRMARRATALQGGASLSPTQLLNASKMKKAATSLTAFKKRQRPALLDPLQTALRSDPSSAMAAKVSPLPSSTNGHSPTDFIQRIENASKAKKFGTATPSHYPPPSSPHSPSHRAQPRTSRRRGS
jgi:hypothetical protein